MDRGRTRIAKTRLDKIIGTNIRNERIVRNMTREELAEVVDLTVSHLGLIERGERGATPVTLEKVVRAFGITVDRLFKEPGSRLSAREQRDRQENTYFKKVSALITHLSEPELELVSHTIRGVLKTRKKGDALENKEIKEIFGE